METDQVHDSRGKEQMKGTLCTHLGRVLENGLSHVLLFIAIPPTPFLTCRVSKGRVPDIFFSNSFIRKVCGELPLLPLSKRETKTEMIL